MMSVKNGELGTSSIGPAGLSLKNVLVVGYYEACKGMQRRWNRCLCLRPSLLAFIKAHRKLKKLIRAIVLECLSFRLYQ